jgi:predicted HicB family RNase H-like nuclease
MAGKHRLDRIEPDTTTKPNPRIPRPLNDALVRLADRERMSINSLIVRLLEEGVARAEASEKG